MPAAENPKARRRPLVLARGVRNTLAGATLVRAARGAQRHVLAAGETKTLCGIDPSAWIETLVESDRLITCPPCSEALKALKASSKASRKAAAS